MDGKFKVAFGFALLLVISLLALAIGLGHVEEKTSFGLQIILGCLATLSGSFASWAFGGSSKDDAKDKR